MMTLILYFYQYNQSICYLSVINWLDL